MPPISRALLVSVVLSVPVIGCRGSVSTPSRTSAPGDPQLSSAAAAEDDSSSDTASSGDASLVCTDLTGTWQNELGSTLYVSAVAADGAVSGWYQSPSGTGGARYPISGWVNSGGPGPNVVQAFAFSVRWEGYGSITSWTGFCAVDSGVTQLQMMWQLVRSTSDYAWDHILTGKDVFHR